MTKPTTENSTAPKGFTLLEIMIGTVLIGILVLGLLGMWGLVDDQFFRVTLRQKAIFALHGHMERLSALYRNGIPFPVNGNSRNYAHHTWLLPDANNFPHIVFGLSAAQAPFSTLNLTVTNLANFGLGTIYLLDRGIIGDSDDDRNVVWLDQDLRITASISWTLEEASTQNCFVASGGLNRCMILTLFLDYPYRFPEDPPTTDPLVAMWDRPETITLKTIVGERQLRTVVTVPVPAP